MRRPDTPTRISMWLLLLLSLLAVVSAQSTTDANNDLNHNRVPRRRKHSNHSIPLSAIQVLPPSPDDTPKECDASKKLYDSCGSERYCAPLPGSNSSSNHTQEPYYYCLHKTLWLPALSATDVLAFLLTGTCCFLAAMAGIGGGGLILPILLICCNFTPKEASVLSNTAVFCNTAGQFCVNNWNKRRNSATTQSSSLIYATVLMIMPGLIAGGSVAITLEGMVPSTAILILALLTLLLASTKTYHKAQKMRAAEREMELQDTPESSTGELSPIATTTTPRLGEEGEEEALIASALEFGDVTPVSKQQLNPSVSNTHNTSNDEPVEDNFLGSIRYLNQETSEENCVNIIDESSLTPSYEPSTVQSTSLSTTRATNNSTPTTTPPRHPTATPSQPLAHYFYNHKLPCLIVGCWALDATTFLLLHTGTLIPKCSAGFFVLVCTPALVAAVFVGLGRRHLLGLKSRDNDDEWQPLIATSSFEQDDHDETYEPVPVLDSTPPPQQQQERPASPTSSVASSESTRNWVLMVPLISAFSGLLKAFRESPTRSHRARNHRSHAVPNLSESLLDDQCPAEIPLSSPPVSNRSFLTAAEEAHDDFGSLLACWLPWASVLIGLLAALLGIGGGELLGPILMLVLKMEPQQSSATTAIMSMMNSGTNMLHYMVADMMVAPGYAFNLGIAGLVGGSGGRLQAMSMADSGRTSVIAMSLFVVLSLATALVAWELATTPISWKSNGSVC